MAGDTPITSGIQTGIQFAQAQANIDLKRQQLESNKNQQAIAKQQADTASLRAVSKTLNEIPQVSAKMGTVLMKQVDDFLINSKRKGLSEVFKASLTDKDPETRATLIRSLATLNRVSNSPQFEEAADTILNEFGNISGMDQIKKFGEQGVRIEEAIATREGRVSAAKFKAQEAQASQRRGQQFTRAKEKRALVTTVRKDVAALSEKFRNQFGAADAILSAKGGPTDDFNMLKGFNQFFDTARVTEGEVQAIKGAQSFANKMRAKFANFKQGDLLSKALRNQIKKTTTRIVGILDEGLKGSVNPIFKQATGQGINPNDFLTDRLQGLFKKEIGALGRRGRRRAAPKPKASKGPVRNSKGAKLKAVQARINSEKDPGRKAKLQRIFKLLGGK